MQDIISYSLNYWTYPYIFTANLAEKIEVEEVKFKKSKEYAVTGLSINQDTGLNRSCYNGHWQIRNNNQNNSKIGKRKNRTDLDLRIKNIETVEKVTPF